MKKKQKERKKEKRQGKGQIIPFTKKKEEKRRERTSGESFNQAGASASEVAEHLLHGSRYWMRYSLHYLQLLPPLSLSIETTDSPGKNAKKKKKKKKLNQKDILSSSLLKIPIAIQKC